MKVSIQGLWHLGTVTAACIAAAGHDVTGLDADVSVIEKLRAGEPPVDEPGLADLLRKGVSEGKLRFSHSREEALTGARVLWVAYDTPVDDDDVADTGFVLDEVGRSLPHLAAGALVIVSSQMPVGSVGLLEAQAASTCPEKGLRFACSPENLRLGKAIEVFSRPDRVVMGIRSEEDQPVISELLRGIASPVVWMSVESAEMTKHAINSFLATSVTFANEIASLCERTGADAKEVEKGLKTESRIGPRAYLSPGAAFAGGTLARDIAFLTEIGAREAVATHLLGAVRTSNDAHKKWTRAKLESLLGSVAGQDVAVLGLTYKAGTDTLRRSLSVELCDWLIERGARLRVHDPAAKALPAHWTANVQRFGTAEECAAAAAAIVVSTEWPEYKTLRIEPPAGRTVALLDPNRFVAHLAAAPGVRYFSVGTAPQGASR